jgi:hypothetical protein
MTTASLSQMLSDFLDGARVVVVAEDGVIAFDLAESKCSVSWTVVRLTTSVDLEHSFGPPYMRGWLRPGQRAGGKAHLPMLFLSITSCPR